MFRPWLNLGGRPQHQMRGPMFVPFPQVIQRPVYQHHPQPQLRGGMYGSPRFINNINVPPQQMPCDVRQMIRQDILQQLQVGDEFSGQSNRNRKRKSDNRSVTEAKKTKVDVDLNQKYLHIQDVKIPPTDYTENQAITQGISYYFIENHQTAQIYNRKLQLREALFTVLQGVLPNCGLYIVGSSMSGFGTLTSDMDLCLMISNAQIDQSKEAPEVLYLIQRALRRCTFLTQSIVIRAKVPILRFTDSISDIECDLNINNSVGIRNTHLLKYFCMSDWRVRPLVLFIKKWARFHDINDASKSTISSYSLSLMVIHYLQYGCDPPVLPVLQKQYPEFFNIKNDIRNLRFDQKLDFKSQNTQSLGALFLGFLRYYTEDYNFNEDVISIRLGVRIPKHDRMFLSSDGLQKKNLCIEEPFDRTNTARSCYDNNVFERVKRVIRKSYHKLSKTRDLSKILSTPF